MEDGEAYIKAIELLIQKRKARFRQPKNAEQRQHEEHKLEMRMENKRLTQSSNKTGQQ